MATRERLGKKTAVTPTQKYLDIAEIRDDTVVLRDGTLRAVLLVSSINFALKSDEEQNAIIQAYVQFLNSVDHSFQIVIQSRRLDIDHYLAKLETREREQANELLKLQIGEYRRYVQELLEIAEIMSKRFYLIVPYDPKTEKKQKGISHKVLDLILPERAVRLSRERFEEEKLELSKRVDFIIEGLRAMDLVAVQLDTQSLIELYYQTYNPEQAKQEKMAELAKLNVEQA